MATSIRQFTATIPAQTPRDNPVTVPLDIPALVVESIDLEVPHGPAGLMAFYLALGGQQAIPWDVGEWLRWDGYTASWPVSDYSTAGTWAVVGYNDGDYDHDVTIRFHLTDQVVASSSSVPVVSFGASPPVGAGASAISDGDLLAAVNGIGAGQSVVTVGGD